MEKNKSIDGLVSSRSKKTAKKPTPAKKPAPVKKPTPAKKSTGKPKKIEKAKATPAVSVEDFLKPVQAFDFSEGDKDFKPAKLSTQPETPPKKEKKAKKKPGKVRKTITTIALILILIILGGGVYLLIWGNDIIAKITGGQGNIFDLFTFMTEKYEPLKTDANGRTNILAFGTSGYNMEGDVGNGVHDGAALTDSIMAISLNQETGDIAMISLPRDLKVFQTCTATAKINEVYWCNNPEDNNEQAGAEALMVAVSDILGLDFQYYAHINWGSLIQIVDTLGGITVVLDEDISDYYLTGAVFEAGVEYNLNGAEALGLARARHGTANGDFSRGASQQKILIGIKNKLIEKNLNVSEYVSLASTLGENLRTNFSVENFKTLAHLITTFDLEQIRQISLIEPEKLMTTGMLNEISYVLPSAGVGNYSKIQNYVAKMTNPDPRIYEDPTILILNGTGTDGLAGAEKITLEKDDYFNIAVDNAPEGDYQDKYTLYALTDKPGTKSLLETRYNTSAKSTDELPENVPRDYDFVIILGGQPD